jgi:mRNA-degrading endonuclease RelE of RelBE toxin-antitoxin system
VAFVVQIVPSALNELKQFKSYYRRRIADAIEFQLKQEPATPTRHRKILEVADASFAFDPPLWELRVGEYRVFYDVDLPSQIVYVRAVREKPPHSTTEEII